MLSEEERAAHVAEQNELYKRNERRKEDTIIAELQTALESVYSTQKQIQKVVDLTKELDIWHQIRPDMNEQIEALKWVGANIDGNIAFIKREQ